MRFHTVSVSSWLWVCWVLWSSSSSSTINMANAHLNHSDLIPEWLPFCFEEGTTLGNMFGCLEDNVLNGTCFVDYGLSDVVNCMVDNLDDISLDNGGASGFLGLLNQLASFVTSFFNATRMCLDPLVDCVYETIEEKIQELELTCVNETLHDLSRCAEENGIDCQTSCNGTMPSTNPFSDNLQLSNLETCSGIQTEIVDPSCTIIDCCEPCIDPFNEFMGCLINNVLNHTTDAEPCEFECTEESRRNTRSLFERGPAHTPGRFLEGLDETSDNPLASQCLQFAPGLTGRDTKELESRSEFFMPCLYENYINTIETQQPGSGGGGGGGGGTKGGTSGAASWGRSAATILALLWLPTLLLSWFG